MTQKLALYFIGQGDGATRVLEAEHQPEYTDTDGTTKRGWVIGRHAISAICFRNGSVSKAHAVISAMVDKSATLVEQDLMWRWELIDRVSTNGTYLEANGHSPYRLAPGVPYEISEGSVAQFGSYKARVKFSFDIDDTHGPIENDTDPNTGINETKKESPPNEATGRTLADVAVLVLTGPPGVNRWLWWLLCAVVGVLIVWLRER